MAGIGKVNADSSVTELAKKKRRLEEHLRNAGSVVVAYSGGVDSAYLAFAAYQALGSGMIAILADSASLARSQYRDALQFAEDHGIPFRVVNTGELEREAYARNAPDRCFPCKDELFRVVAAE